MLAPTSCEYNHMWYVVRYSNSKACTNGDRPPTNRYDSSKECCDKEFDETTSGSGASGDGCRHINTCFDTCDPTPTPTSCKYDRMWYLVH